MGLKGFFMTTSCTVLELLKYLKYFAHVFRYINKQHKFILNLSKNKDTYRDICGLRQNLGFITMLQFSVSINSYVWHSQLFK